MDKPAGLDERFAPVLKSLGESAHPDAAAIGAQLAAALMTGAPAATMAKWCRDHHGQTVTTIQIDNNSGDVWAPQGRVVDAQSYATRALFDGSARDYAGMRVLVGGADVLIVADDWHTVAYLAS